MFRQQKVIEEKAVSLKCCIFYYLLEEQANQNCEYDITGFIMSWEIFVVSTEFALHSDKSFTQVKVPSFL